MQLPRFAGLLGCCELTAMLVDANGLCCIAGLCGRIVPVFMSRGWEGSLNSSGIVFNDVFTLVSLETDVLAVRLATHEICRGRARCCGALGPFLNPFCFHLSMQDCSHVTAFVTLAGILPRYIVQGERSVRSSQLES